MTNCVTTAQALREGQWTSADVSMQLTREFSLVTASPRLLHPVLARAELRCRQRRADERGMCRRPIGVFAREVRSHTAGDRAQSWHRDSMSEQWHAGRGVYRLLGSVMLAFLAASCWWAWMAWDHSYQVDPATGETSGPYEAWQVIGCVLCLVLVGVVATMRLPVWIVVPIMTVGFTGAWSWTATGVDDSGLWLVGAVYVFVGMFVGTAMVSGVTAVVRVAGSGDVSTSELR